jgi:hypothetical protein
MVHTEDRRKRSKEGPMENIPAELIPFALSWKDEFEESREREYLMKLDTKEKSLK